MHLARLEPAARCAEPEPGAPRCGGQSASGPVSRQPAASHPVEIGRQLPPAVVRVSVGFGDIFSSRSFSASGRACAGGGGVRARVPRRGEWRPSRAAGRCRRGDEDDRERRRAELSEHVRAAGGWCRIAGATTREAPMTKRTGLPALLEKAGFSWWTRIEARSSKIRNYEPLHFHHMNRRLEDVWLAKK